MGHLLDDVSHLDHEAFDLAVQAFIAELCQRGEQRHAPQYTREIWPSRSHSEA